MLHHWLHHSVNYNRYLQVVCEKFETVDRFACASQEWFGIAIHNSTALNVFKKLVLSDILDGVKF